MPQVILGNYAVTGISSLQFTGGSIFVSEPERGSLITEYSASGTPQRTIGRLRDTGYEQERDLHLALNAGLPLIDPTGGFFYVFLTGQPMFRKYDANGKLLFERHIEGREIDDLLAAQPTKWPTRRIEDREVPFVQPMIRTAAVDPQGQLWVSMVVPYTYVYDYARRQGADRPVQRDRSHQPDKPVLHARRPHPRDPRLLRIRSAADRQGHAWRR